MPFALAPSGAASNTPSAAEPPRAAVARDAKKPPRETAEVEETSGSAGASPLSLGVAAILVTRAASLILACMVRFRGGRSSACFHLECTTCTDP